MVDADAKISMAVLIFLGIGWRKVKSGPYQH